MNEDIVANRVGAGSIRNLKSDSACTRLYDRVVRNQDSARTFGAIAQEGGDPDTEVVIDEVVADD